MKALLKTFSGCKTILVSMLFMFFLALPSTASAANLSFTVTQDYGQAQQVLKLVNKERTRRGLTALTMDKTLTSNAITRATELLVQVPFTSPHKRPNGKDKSSINSSICYEDCAESTGSPISPSQVVNSWMNSATHRRGILLSSARSVGVAFVYVEGPGGYGGHYVLDFSNSSAKSVEKSTKTKELTVKVPALSKYFTKSWFNLHEYSREDSTVTFRVGYKSNQAYNSGWLASSAFKWTSGNKKIASISSKGVASFKKSGTVTFTATLKANKSIKVKLKYKYKEEPEYYW